MKKAIASLVIVGLLILLGPKLVKTVIEFYGHREHNIAGKWEITYTIYQDEYRGTYEFEKVNATGEGLIYHENSEVGKYKVNEKNITFTLAFKDPAKHQFEGNFEGMIYNIDRIDIRIEMRGTLTGTRVVEGIRVETEGKWEAVKF